MKAIFLKKFGEAERAFELKEVEKPAPKSNEVLIKVSCFGLNYAEVMARNGLYGATPKLPCVLGYEVAGEIVAVGSEVNKDFIGKKVVAFTRFGGYAQYAVTDKNAFVEINNLNEEEACCIAVQYATAFYMSNFTANLHANQHVLIHAGAGGVGTALIQLAKLKNCVVYAHASSNEKLEFMKMQGADFVLNYSAENYVEYYQKKRIKFDVIFNPIAGSTFKKDYKLLASGGKLFLYGGSERSGKKFGIFSTFNFLRKMGRIIPIFLVGHSKSILGINMLKIGDDKPNDLKICLDECMHLFKAGKINPHVGAVFQSDELPKAHALLESRKSIGKIVVKW